MQPLRLYHRRKCKRMVSKRDNTAPLVALRFKARTLAITVTRLSNDINPHPRSSDWDGETWMGIFRYAGGAQNER